MEIVDSGEPTGCTETALRPSGSRLNSSGGQPAGKSLTSHRQCLPFESVRLRPTDGTGSDFKASPEATIQRPGDRDQEAGQCGPTAPMADRQRGQYGRPGRFIGAGRAGQLLRHRPAAAEFPGRFTPPVTVAGRESLGGGVPGLPGPNHSDGRQRIQFPADDSIPAVVAAFRLYSRKRFRPIPPTGSVQQTSQDFLLQTEEEQETPEYDRRR